MKMLFCMYLAIWNTSAVEMVWNYLLVTPYCDFKSKIHIHYTLYMLIIALSNLIDLI